MALTLEDYHRKITNCIERARHCDGSAVGVWLELADTYRLLIKHEQDFARANIQRAKSAELEKTPA